MALRIQILTLLISAQIWLSTSQFVFELEVDTDSATLTAGNINCDSGFFDDAQCLIYFSVFCLREEREGSQSTNEGDCPLGRNTERLNAYLESQPNTRRITSQTPWPGVFQLYIRARDSDPGPSRDDDLDDIIINRALEVNTSFTELEGFTGILNKVTVQIRFRVTCQQDYYGTDCSTFCLEHNDDVNGHYTCNSRDGFFQCLEGFENPQNNCRDTVIDPCDSSPCSNNGSCILTGPSNYTCQCTVGYTGPTCEVDISHCLSATCPNNSMCVDGIDSYECVCNPDFMLNGDKCIRIPVTKMKNQGTPMPGGGSFTISASEPTPTALYGVAAASVALIVVLLITFTVVLTVVIIKWKRKEVQQDGKWMTDSLSSNIKLDNPTYTGQLSESSCVIPEPNKPTSLEATEHTVDNPVYGEDANYNSVSVKIIHNVQNPIYGDNVGESVQQPQDQLYDVINSPQTLLSLGVDAGEKGQEYDYAVNGEMVNKENVSSVLSLQAVHEYAVIN